jgi:hypothetical protein
MFNLAQELLLAKLDRDEHQSECPAKTDCNRSVGNTRGSVTVEFPSNPIQGVLRSCERISL